MYSDSSPLSDCVKLMLKAYRPLESGDLQIWQLRCVSQIKNLYKFNLIISCNQSLCLVIAFNYEQ